MKNSLLLATSPVSGVVHLGGSKSISNRVLLMAACANGISVIENIPLSNDVQACIAALGQLGVKVDYNKVTKVAVIHGCGGVFPNKNANVFCNEAGTLTRFIIALCAMQSSGVYHISAAQVMMDRPLKELLVELAKLGMKADYCGVEHKLPMTIHGGKRNNVDLSVSGSRSSQFVSGLLMSLPLLNLDLSVSSITDHSQPYVDMTIKTMSDFGVNVKSINHTYYMCSGQSYKSKKIIVEPDVSTASYFWAAAAITGGTVIVKNVSDLTMQGDIEFLSVLKKMGCDINSADDGIAVTGPDVLNGVSVNMRNFSDTFMSVAVVACFASNETLLTGLAHTKGQESDRLQAMFEGLTNLGVFVKVDGDSIYIDPERSNLRSATVDSYNDHRIAMSLALLGIHKSGVVINGAECVAKTCPDYFALMNDMIQ